MTDISPSFNTLTAPVLNGNGSLHTFVKVAQAAKHTVPVTEDEEDYTIKCICRFNEDDGNTVLCERCETWQHIECYYFADGTVPDVTEITHFCADCEPRPLDAKSATERQSTRMEQPDPGERKIKKTTTKSHKKKIKVPEPNGALTNGWSHDKNDLAFPHDRTSRSPRDQLLHAKRPKTSHRLSSSINSPMTTSAPLSQLGKRSGSASHAMQSSPKMPTSHSPNGYSSDPFSSKFLHLYDNDPGDTPLQANLFNDITITRSLSSWSHDTQSLREATNGLLPGEVFHRCEQPLDSMTLPQLRKQHKQHPFTDCHGQHPQWIFLTIDSFIPRDSIVGELKGKVGHMKDYTEDTLNRWDYLRHPVPFVFFHPKLPIYIDTRSEGTTSRYLRRSCRPNLSMKTILEEGDYRFCFIAKTDLEAGSELTIGWVLDEHMRSFVHNRNHEDIKLEGIVDAGEDYAIDWVGRVLADFGGCACDDPSQCALARYDRRHGTASTGSVSHLSNGVSRKVRNGYAKKTSPPSTGQATNSRAASEGMKHQEDDDRDDSRSTSGSTRSKPRSRETTPTHGIALGQELSVREKRKIAALEKTFENLEQDKHQPAQKKKKRNSGGSNLNTPSAGTSKQLDHIVTSLSQPNTPNISSRPRYTDPGTSHRTSDSSIPKHPHFFDPPNSVHVPFKRSSLPNTPLMASPLVPQNYVDSSVQTDAEENDDWYKPAGAQIVPRRPFVSLTKRLLLRCQRDRAKVEERERATSTPSTDQDAHSAQLSSPDVHVKDPSPVNPIARVAREISDDVEMHDVGLGVTLDPDSLPTNLPVQKPRPPDQESNLPHRLEVGDVKSPPLSSVPSDAKPPDVPVLSTNGFRPADLRVHLPPTPQLPLDFSESSITATPSSITSRSPFTHTSNHTSNSYPPLFSAPASNHVQPSPAKKKVSLSDYMSRKKTESHSVAEKHTSSSPVLQQHHIKPFIGTQESVKALAAEGSTTAETQTKEERVELGQESKDPKL